MENSIQDEVARFVKMSWDHEYAEHGILSKSDAIQFAELYASLLKEELSALREENERLRKALGAGYECINYLGDLLNEMDAVEPEDEEYTTPLINKVTSALHPSHNTEEKLL
jgi:ssDNA-specific exonuclease RecJ